MQKTQIYIQKKVFLKSHCKSQLPQQFPKKSQTIRNFYKLKINQKIFFRQRDTNALIEAVESGTVDPNFTDDVGQTLLNWCSAFGTLEMVNYLCDKGADVNCGQRSSSLHYAACFGRVDVSFLKELKKSFLKYPVILKVYSNF